MSLLHTRIKTYLVAVFLVAGGVGGAGYFGPKIVTSKEVKSSPSISTSTVKNSTNTQQSTVFSRSEPTRLRISSIAINAPLIKLDLKSDGTLSTPDSATDAGWYTKSPTPGEIGPSIIVGHVDYKNHGAAVFWHLNKLRSGDTIEIDRADGTIAKFKVDSVKQFSQSNFPTNEVYGNINFAGIRLITCSGIFNSQTGHYSDNTVVFGSLVSEKSR